VALQVLVPHSESAPGHCDAAVQPPQAAVASQARPLPHDVPTAFGVCVGKPEAHASTVHST
jgi:hypothetical protein